MLLELLSKFIGIVATGTVCRIIVNVHRLVAKVQKIVAPVYRIHAPVHSTVVRLHRSIGMDNGHAVCLFVVE